MYQTEFKEMFELLFCATDNDQTEFPDWKPLNFANPVGMAAIQKGLGLGGACKIKRFLCHCYTLMSDDCADPNSSIKICIMLCQATIKFRLEVLPSRYVKSGATPTI